MHSASVIDEGLPKLSIVWSQCAETLTTLSLLVHDVSDGSLNGTQPLRHHFEETIMKMPLRLLAFTSLGLLGLAAPARSQIIIGGPLVPTRTVYMPTTTVVSQPIVARTPIGPTAYV